MADTAALVRLMTWLSPAFPVGAFSYSGGLEQAVSDGDVRDAETLSDWLLGLLAHGALWNDAVLLAEAHRAQDDPVRLAGVAALAEALRDAGVRVELDVRLRGAKANLRHADRTGIPLALLVGSRERERGEALLRRMESREERTVKLEQLTSTVCRELAAGVSNGAH